MNDRDLDRACEGLLDWVGSLDTTWKTNLKILRDERGLSAKQALGACLAYVLDHGLYMHVSTNPAFEPDMTVNARGERECPVCGKMWQPMHRGQPVCSNECAEAFYARPDPYTPTKIDPAVEFPAQSSRAVQVSRAAMVEEE